MAQITQAHSRLLALAAAASLFSACASSSVERSLRSSDPAASPSWAPPSDATQIAPELGLLAETPVLLEGEEMGGTGDEDATGTDPRGFATKFMPYFRYTELENGLEEYQATAFGLIRFSERTAFTYEVPVAMERDFSGVSGFDGGGPTTPNGLPNSGDTAGLGDSNIRMFSKLGRWAGMDWMGGFQLTFPTGSNDALSSKKFQAGPMVVNVIDIPKLHAFLAMMHISQFSVFGDDDRDDIALYVGRWFYMQPLSKPGPGLGDGWYLLPEFQPVYDFENSEASLWIGPEVGKIVAPGRVLYLKPGFGVDPEGGERETTFEAGFRWFF